AVVQLVNHFLLVTSATLQHYSHTEHSRGRSRLLSPPDGRFTGRPRQGQRQETGREGAAGQTAYSPGQATAVAPRWWSIREINDGDTEARAATRGARGEGEEGVGGSVVVHEWPGLGPGAGVGGG
ncbi:unnamed protein product, partial [Ectocarpus sp. 8 AP-2014]